MFIVKDAPDEASSVRSVMLTLRPYGTGCSFVNFNYKHCVPTGLLRPLLSLLNPDHIFPLCFGLTLARAGSRPSAQNDGAHNPSLGCSACRCISTRAVLAGLQTTNRRPAPQVMSITNRVTGRRSPARRWSDSFPRPARLK